MLAQAHRDRAGLAVADRPAAPGGLDRAHRRDDRRRATGEHLGDRSVGVAVPPLVDADPALDASSPRSPATCRIESRVTPGQQGAGELGGDAAGVVAGPVHEVEVHAAHLLDPAVLDGVEPDDLVASLGGGLGLGDQAGGVVAGALGLAGAAGCGAHVLGRQPHRHRLDAAVEVGAGRGRDQQEQVRRGGLHAETDLGREHERPQVEAHLAVVGHPRLVLLDERLRARRGRAPRGAQAWRAGAPTAGSRAAFISGRNVAIEPSALAVGLEPLEDLLAVVQGHGRRVELERAVGHQLRVVPAAALGPLDGHHVVGEVPAEPRARRGCASRCASGSGWRASACARSRR